MWRVLRNIVILLNCYSGLYARCGYVDHISAVPNKRRKKKCNAMKNGVVARRNETRSLVSLTVFALRHVMRASTAPEYHHPRPTSPPTSAGAITTTPALALEFIPSPLEIKSERPLICIRILAIVTPLRAALDACHSCCYCTASSRCVGCGGKAMRALCTALLLLRSGCRARRGRCGARRRVPILF